MTIEEWHDWSAACRDVLAQCPNGYAKTYARYGLACSEAEIPTQALYILSNIGHWRGDVAKMTRATLKRFVPK